MIRAVLPTANPCPGGEQGDPKLRMDDSFVDVMTSEEKGLLTGVNGDGMIGLPQGSARVTEQTLRRLKHLIQLGFVRYTRKKNWYRAWWLTRKGRRLIEAIRTFQRDSSVRRPGQSIEPRVI
jgi:hypothetical protein